MDTHRFVRAHVHMFSYMQALPNNRQPTARKVIDVHGHERTQLDRVQHMYIPVRQLTLRSPE